MYPRIGHTINYAEFIPYCSNSKFKTNPSTNCAEKFCPEVYNKVSNRNDTYRSTNMKCIKILKFLQWISVDSHKNHDFKLMCINHEVDSHP